MIQARKLRELRDAAGFTLRQMAELLDEDERALAALESADAPLDPELLDRCARAFGMTVERLLSDDAVQAPALLLFRSLNPEVISELRARRAHFGLGDFLRGLCAMGLSLDDVHVRQSTGWSCVAACVCMVRRRRGERVEEPAILEAWAPEARSP